MPCLRASSPTEAPASYVPVTPKGSKISRFEGISGLFESKRIFLPEEASWLLEFSREAIRDSYARAFEVYNESIELEETRDWERARLDASLDQFQAQLTGFDGDAFDQPLLSEEEIGSLLLRAVAKDYHADYLSGIVILFADNLIQRLGKNLLGSAPNLDRGFGYDYGDHRGSAPFTFLVRAAANSLRHVDEWDDHDWGDDDDEDRRGKIYPDMAEASNREKIMLKSIHIFRNALGIGVSERIRDVQSLRVLIRIDELLNEKPDYHRFEQRLFEAAREIAKAAGGESKEKLEEQIGRLDCSD
jgi:hypothetical protein